MPESYALTCEALATFDVIDRLAEIVTPVLAVAGAADIPTPPESLQRIASGVKDGRLVVLDGVGHLAPAEAPATVAALIAEHFGVDRTPPGHHRRDVYRAGMAVRREVLGDAHVDRAVAGDHRAHRRLPAHDHRVRVGHDLDPAGSRPPQSLDDHSDGTGGARPPRGTGDAPARGPPKRHDERRDQGAAHADGHLLRRPGCELGVPHRRRGVVRLRRDGGVSS